MMSGWLPGKARVERSNQEAKGHRLEAFRLVFLFIRQSGIVPWFFTESFLSGCLVGGQLFRPGRRSVGLEK
jgi:hypothetical protein